MKAIVLTLGVCVAAVAGCASHDTMPNTDVSDRVTKLEDRVAQLEQGTATRNYAPVAPIERHFPDMQPDTP